MNFEGKPTLTEIKDEISRQINSAPCEAKIIKITLTKKYSHQAIKKVLGYLGYKPCTKKPEKNFDIRKK